MLTKQPVPYDLCVCVPISRLLTAGYRLCEGLFPALHATVYVLSHTSPCSHSRHMWSFSTAPSPEKFSAEAGALIYLASIDTFVVVLLLAGDLAHKSVSV